jgi:hypothetical protein
MTKLEKMIRGAVGGFEIVAAKKIVKEINKSFSGNVIGFNEYKACKDALVDNLTNPEHDRIRILNMFTY